MTTVEVEGGGDVDEAVSPRQQTSMAQVIQPFGSMNNSLESLDLRADPDAQATVTDFLDFTEYLPADMMRSLTLIGKLDQTYIDASTNVHELTTTWGRLPDMAPEERPAPVQLRATISESLNHALNSRVYAHAEAVRMAENVNRHYNRAKTILAKLKILRENYPTAEEQKSPVAPKSPQMVRTPKAPARAESGQQKLRRQRVPRITVPGEVLAPYELDYETYSDESDESSSSDEEESPQPRMMASQPRIRLIKPANKLSKIKMPKSTSSVYPPSFPNGYISTSSALAQLKPPPENAVLGSSDAPWLQLTPYELAKLRKRMKKNAQWTPSETMIARELKVLGRGFESWREAKKRAEDEGRTFENTLPMPVVDSDGVAHPPLGALSIDAAVAADDKHNTNRGMKLNEAKKLKKESTLAQLAAQEAEESTRRMLEAARAIFAPTPMITTEQPVTRASSTKPQARKRKRDTAGEADAEKAEASETPSQRPLLKRTKTETPVPIPQPTPSTSASAPAHETPVHPPQLTPGSTAVKPKSTTPVPTPIPTQEQSIVAASGSSPSNSSNLSGAGTVTTTVPVKPPGETPIPPPLHSPRKSTTPIFPPVRELRTREVARKEQQKDGQAAPPPPKPASRATTPAASSTTAEAPRRPQSRGKAMSQEPPASLASERPRRASTARNTPAPEVRQANKRPKRPAPGVISRTNSGGNSAVGRRKAAPKKKRGAQKRVQAEVEIEVEGEVEVDDEGNVVDPDEPRYCLCNRVSFGTMIQCDNIDNCKQEWFHLECVDLTDIPARTTKWYCPDCRVLLNIGEKGEVSARGVRM